MGLHSRLLQLVLISDTSTVVLLPSSTIDMMKTSMNSLLQFLNSKQYEYRIRLMALIKPSDCYITIVSRNH
jgi:hypothetical protein